jgi:hypothetical protein
MPKTTYIHITQALSPKEIAETSQILLQEAPILPKLLPTKNTDVTGGKPIAI